MYSDICMLDFTLHTFTDTPTYSIVAVIYIDELKKKLGLLKMKS